MNRTLSAALILIALATLAGCGNKGPLFLPPPAPVETGGTATKPAAEDEPAVSDDEDATDAADGDAKEDPAGDANG